MDQGTDARIDPRRFSAYSIFKSFVTRSLAKVSDGLDLELQRD